MAKKITTKKLLSKVLEYNKIDSDNIIDQLLTKKIAVKLQQKQQQLKNKLFEADNTEDSQLDVPVSSKFQSKGNSYYQIINTKTNPPKKLYVSFEKSKDSPGTYIVDYFDYNNKNTKIAGIKYAMNVGISQFPNIIDVVLEVIYQFLVVRKGSVNKILFLPKGIFTKDINVRLNSEFSKYMGKFKSLGFNMDRNPKENAFWEIAKGISTKTAIPSK